MSIIQLAERYIPQPNNKTELKYNNGNTDDIIKVVLDCYEKSRLQLVKFAPYLKGATVLETCKNIFDFWKGNVPYKVDAPGGQWVKTPAAFWKLRIGDCKSFSVAVASTLHALGIEGKFRFVSFGNNTTAPTHVYVVAMDKGQEIIIDCVWIAFNKQKAYKKNWDYNMSKIYMVSGFSDSTRTYMQDVDTDITQAELELQLNKEKLLAERSIHRKISGIGTLVDDAYTTEIVAHQLAINELRNNVAGIYGPTKGKKAKGTTAPTASKKITKLAAKNNGKGVTKAQAKKLQKAGVTVVKRKEKLVKRVAASAKKIVAAPVLLAAKTQLPKNAAFFLYTYITDAKLLAALPSIVASKRAKAIQYKAVLVDKLGMKETNFNKTVRNGIMNQFGKSPEQVLADWTLDYRKQNNIAGIGVIATLGVAAAGIKKLLSTLGIDAESLEQSAPAQDDWATVAKADAETLATEIKEQADNNEPTTGKGSVQPINDEGDYAVKKISTVPSNPQVAPTQAYNESDVEVDTTTQAPAEKKYEASTNDVAAPAEAKEANTAGELGADKENGMSTGIVIAAVAAAAILLSK